MGNTVSSSLHCMRGAESMATALALQCWGGDKISSSLHAWSSEDNCKIKADPFL